MLLSLTFRNLAAHSQKAINPTPMIKKFYKQCTYETNSNPLYPLHKYLITLDGKSVLTPQRNVLAVPSKGLAEILVREFNRQDKNLVSGDMPFLALCRTAVDADFDQQIGLHLRSVINNFLATDSLNFYEQYYSQLYNKEAKPVLTHFTKTFSLPITPTISLTPPQVLPSPQFTQWLESLNNWQLMGVEQITAWLQSIVAGYYVVSKGGVDEAIRAAHVEEYYQIGESGETQDKRALMRNIRFMVDNGLVLYRLGKIMD